jgi:HK97 family phage major capsid protein
VIQSITTNAAFLEDIQALAAVEQKTWDDKLHALKLSGVPMNAYDNIVSRSDAAALVPEDVSREIWKNVPQQSAALTLFRQVRMSSKVQRQPILSALPVAYFVNGDTGLKQTTELNWANKYLEAEEIAVIVPVPDAVLDDVDYDIWGEAKPLIVEAIGRTLDAAVFFGTNKPGTWPTHIVGIATGAGNSYARGTSTVAQGGLAEDLNQVFSTVEDDGFDVNGVIANRRMRGRFRSHRNTDGDKSNELTADRVLDEEVTYPMRGMWPTGASVVELIAGDFSHGIIGIRQDITWKILDQAVIQDNTGAIVYNLAQQDMVAMRCVFRAGYQVSNAINYDQPTEANRSPFGVLLSPA